MDPGLDSTWIPGSSLLPGLCAEQAAAGADEELANEAE